MDVSAQIIDTMETSTRSGGTSSDVIAVVGKLLSRRQPRRFSDDFVAFDHQLTAVRVSDDPFASKECDRVVGAVVDGDEIDKSVRLVRRQTFPSVVIHEFIEMGDEAGKGKGSGHGEQPTHRRRHCNRFGPELARSERSSALRNPMR